MSVSLLNPMITHIIISCLHLEASSSKPSIHSLMLHATAGVWFVFVVPPGCPDPLALVLFSTTASTIAQQHSCTVFTIVSTWSSPLAQLTGLAMLNPTSLALPRESPSLSDHHPKNMIIFPEARTTASVIHSSRPSQIVLAINELVHAWEGGGWSSPSFPKVTLTWMH